MYCGLRRPRHCRAAAVLLRTQDPVRQVSPSGTLPTLPRTLKGLHCPHTCPGSGQPGKCHISSSAAPRFGRVGHRASHWHLRQLWRGPEWGPSREWTDTRTKKRRERRVDGGAWGVVSGLQTNKQWTLFLFCLRLCCWGSGGRGWANGFNRHRDRTGGVRRGWEKWVWPTYVTKPGLPGCGWQRKAGPGVRPPCEPYKEDRTWKGRIMRGPPNFYPSSGTALPSTCFPHPQIEGCLSPVLI